MKTENRTAAGVILEEYLGKDRWHEIQANREELKTTAIELRYLVSKGIEQNQSTIKELVALLEKIKINGLHRGPDCYSLLNELESTLSKVKL